MAEKEVSIMRTILPFILFAIRHIAILNDLRVFLFFSILCFTFV